MTTEQGNLINSLQSQNQLKIKAIETKDQNQPEEEKKEEETIVCWNCLTVLVVKPEWNIVQCTNCDKFNRIPKEKPEKPENLSLNTNKNHFDVIAPYVYAVMTCPYCQAENKVRKEAEHIICYQCFNSFSIENPTIKCISSKKALTIPSKCTRISDMYFPDPMMYPGKYPLPEYFVTKQCDECQDRKFLVDEMVRNVVSQKPKAREGKIDKFAALRAMMRDVDEIDSKRNLKIQRGISGKNIMKEYVMSNIEKNYFNNNNNSKVNMRGSAGYNGGIKQDMSDNFLNKRKINSMNQMNNKNKAVYKMMFSNWNNSYNM